MSLPYTILGFLSLEPMTGYDLKKMMDNSTQLFWHAELSQIYPVLKQLEVKGLVKADAVPQGGKPDKKRYSITPNGRQCLIVWLNEPLDETPPTKSPVLLKMFFLGILDKEKQAIITQNISSVFYPEEVIPNTKELNVIIKGTLAHWVGGTPITPIKKNYIIKFNYRSGNLKVVSFFETSETQYDH